MKSEVYIVFGPFRPLTHLVQSVAFRSHLINPSMCSVMASVTSVNDNIIGNHEHSRQLRDRQALNISQTAHSFI